MDTAAATKEYPGGSTIRCHACYTPPPVIERTSEIETIMPMTDIERTYDLDNTTATLGIRNALKIVRGMVIARHGLLLMHGQHGTGKTRLLIGATNAMRKDGTAIFATVEELFRYLRAGYNTQRQRNGELDFDQRWDLVRNADLLALDELEKHNPTNWAATQFQELIDYRWRHIATKLTIAAMNGDWRTELAPAIADRFDDGRGRIVELTGPSFRHNEKWSNYE